MYVSDCFLRVLAGYLGEEGGGKWIPLSESEQLLAVEAKKQMLSRSAFLV